jgi:hypothetical protein
VGKSFDIFKTGGVFFKNLDPAFGVCGIDRLQRKLDFSAIRCKPLLGSYFSVIPT